MTGIKGVIFGKHGIGKTSLVRDLPEDTTLVIDMEAGLLAAEGWKGDKRTVRTWTDARVLAALIGGANPSSPEGQPYSKAYYDRCLAHAREHMPDFDPTKYDTVFVDSITEASRLCFSWAESQPESITKQGALNPLKAYGLLGQEMIKWFKQFQHAKDINVWFVGGLDRKEVEGGAPIWEPQIEGSKATNELAGIFDQVVTMTQIDINRDGKVIPQRAFVCQMLNQWRYPAKDRSGTLNLIEEPNLAKLMDKIRTAQRKDMRALWSEILTDEIIY
jgi:hypothetical protein